MKKVISILMIIVLLIGLLSACGSDDKTESKPQGSNQTASELLSTEDVNFVEDGKSVYTVVYSKGEKEEYSSAVRLFQKMKNTLGVRVDNYDDSKDGNDRYEILVGNTNSPETEALKNYYINSTEGKGNDFIIATVGKKIVIYGFTNAAIENGVEYFLTEYLKADGVKGGIKYVGLVGGNYENITINGTKIGKFGLVKPRFNESYITQLQIDKLTSDVMTASGYPLQIIEDHNAAKDFEIIVGAANRDGVAEISDRDEYIIKISGNKVYLNGGSPAAKAMAVSEFGKMLAKGNVTDADSVTGKYSVAVADYDTASHYTPTWKEDFDFDSNGLNGVNLENWTISMHGVWVEDGQNGRESMRTENNVFVKDGMLNGLSTKDDEYYYGFCIDSKKNMQYLYGIVEMSAKLPDGESFWSALWTKSYHPNHKAAYTIEVDVVEMFGNSKVEVTNIHGWLKGSDYAKKYYEEKWKPLGKPEHWAMNSDTDAQRKHYCVEGKFNDALHTFTYIWTPDKMSFACDGNVYFELDLNSDEVYKETASQRQYLIVSTAVCYASQLNTMPDDSPAWSDPNRYTYLVDYVHLYQLNDGQHILDTDPYIE